MSQQTINIGTSPNDGTGDPLRTWASKTNSNFEDLYGTIVLPINQVSDFPTQDATTITLETGFAYNILSKITTGKRFVCQVNSAVTGPALNIEAIEYTGSLPMFTTTGQFYMSQLNFKCVSSDIFAHGPGGFVVLNSCVCSAADGVGVVSSAFLTLIHTAFFNIATSGLSFTGTGNRLVMFDSLISPTLAMDVLDLGTATFSNFDIAECSLIGPVGSVSIKGDTDSGNVETGHIAVVLDCELGGLGTALQGIDPDDALWSFQLNEGARDTLRDALVSVQGNALETNMGGATGNPVKANAVFTVGPQSGFTGDTTGTVTYDLPNDIRVPVTASLTLKKASGGSSRVLACIAENGVVVAQSCIGVDCSNSASGNVTLIWQSDLSQTNYVEVWLENPTVGGNTTNNVLVDAVFRVN
jgi:hypothetical protein